MVGSQMKDAVVQQLGKLLRREVSSDEPLLLRSIHRSAFSSWARQHQLPIPGDMIAGSVPFTVEQLLSGVVPIVVKAPTKPPPSTSISEGFYIGIDIEDVDSLPETTNYRDHPFFLENFSPTEISHCLQQVNTRASFCGLWAAKEAVIKAGIASSGVSLGHIEIRHNASGKPIYPGCDLSISHSPAVAVAVCLAGAINTPRPYEVRPSIVQPSPELKPSRRWSWFSRSS